MQVFAPEKFEAAMAAADLTAVSLARAMIRRGATIDRRVIAYWLDGHTKAPSAEYLRLACELMNVPEAALFEDTDAAD